LQPKQLEVSRVAIGTSRILEIKAETPDVKTYRLQFLNPELQKSYSFVPGQYNMVGSPHIGEAPISLSSSPEEKEFFEHTIRAVGRVTSYLDSLKVGDTVTVRGPYGKGWPLQLLTGRDVVIMAGGTGIAPVKPVINYLVKKRELFKHVEVLYGAKTRRDLLFISEHERWQEANITLRLTVDIGTQFEWPFCVGVVPMLIKQVEINPPETVIFISGPEIMMRFCLTELINRGFKREHIFITLERHMQCGVKMCGHCMLGPKYVCQDGPVFNYQDLEGLFGVVA